MAEGIQTESFHTKYYCHQCLHEVSPYWMAELVCPDCSSGCIEEVSNNTYPPDTYSCPDDEDESDLEDVSNIEFLPNTMDGFFSRVLMNVAEELPEENEPSEPRSRLFRRDSLSDIIRHISMRDLLNTDEEGDESQFVSFRYFDDYTGDEEIDALASQLLDEVEVSGPPPLSKDQIKSIPSHQILEKGLQCTVCMDDFSLRDKAKQLQCKHLFHEKCITPWLERQATCPNCREIVQVQLKNKRSRSCPRTRLNRLNPRNGDTRRYSDASSLSNFFTTSMDPFRFYN